MSEIVRRQEEVGKALELWEGLCQGKAETTCLEFYGIPGIGKTELVKQIKGDLESMEALCAYLDFNPVRNPGCKSYSSDPKTLLDVLIHGWKLSLTDPSAAQIVDEVKRCDSKDTVVLICDETDKIPEELDWFEEKLIWPLMLSTHCLIIWVGQRQKQWDVRHSELKLKVLSSPVEPIPDNAVIKTCLAARGVPSDEIDRVLVPWIRDITFGHPLAEQVAASTYCLHRGKTEEELKKEIAEAIEEQVIQNYVFQGNKLSASDLYFLALMRTANIELFRTKSSPSSVTSSPHPLGFRELKSTTLSGEPPRGFCQETISRWLSKFYSVVRPDEYVNAQDILIRGCQELASKSIERRDMTSWRKYAVEQLYHSACANTGQPGRYDLVKTITDCLSELNNSALLADSDKDDWKSKLESLIRGDKELYELIGSDALDKIISAIR
jgi:hypothetical protein